MKYALVDGTRSVASPDAHTRAKCLCAFCEGPVVAHTEASNLHHWVHRDGGHCDGWWEAETPWHRHMKNLMPDHWQEIACGRDDAGGRHVADLRTSDGTVVVMRGAPLSPDEMNERVKHYKAHAGTLMWLVDTGRTPETRDAFKGMLKTVQKPDEMPNLQFIQEADFSPLLKEWQNRAEPVAFDLNNGYVWILVGCMNMDEDNVDAQGRSVADHASETGFVAVGYLCSITQLVEIIESYHKTPDTESLQAWLTAKGNGA